jgi:hypothetical protein
MYTGPSMNPTLQNLDKLFYAPYRDAKVKRGDVVVFFDHEKNIKIIHRVKNISRQGIVTMGDNNSRVDSAILKPSQILGQVRYGQRRNKWISIHGGFFGEIQAAKVGLFLMVYNALRETIKPPYHLLSGRIKLPIRTKILSFQRPEGEELHLLMGRVVVGRLLPGRKWQIRPPFQLFLNLSALPANSDQSKDDQQKKRSN